MTQREGDAMTPTPGSPEAVEQGCRCPIMDNGHGRGVYVDAEGNVQFWTADDCPLHGASEAKAARKGEQR